jgi:putative thioredoxin
MNTSELFEKFEKKSQDKPVVIQFFANWCGPCKVLKPVLKKLAEENDGKWDLLMLDVEKYPEVAGKFNIRSIPTVHLFYKGSSIASFSGAKQSYIIQNWLDNHLGEIEEKDETLALLKQGNVGRAKEELMKYLDEQHPDSPVIKLLLALQHMGKNNPEAMQQLNKVDRTGKWGKLAKVIRDRIDIDNDEKDVHSPTHSPYYPAALDANSRIDINDFDTGFLNLLVHDMINEIREKKGLRTLKVDPVLEAAARDQNGYMIKFDVLTHHQDNTMKKTVMDRVKAFGGNFRRVGENVQYQGMQIRQKNNQQEIITDSYLNTAKKIVNNWVNSPGHYRNLIHPDFTFVGTSTGWNPENYSIFATQVFAT